MTEAGGAADRADRRGVATEGPFDAIRAALTGGAGNISPGLQQVDVSDKQGQEPRIDAHRRARTGVPEFVLSEGKHQDQVISALRQLVSRNRRAIATRCEGSLVDILADAFCSTYEVHVDRQARVVVVNERDVVPELTGGVVGILTAGASDLPIAREAAVIAREMGCAVLEASDVGVAGLHRLVQPLEAMIAQGADVLVVAAGMDGALPSVVSGLVALPVIGLPTSVGYGHGGRGQAALAAMLQTCSPGLTVVNIDNGVGAGSSAALIANRVAATRTQLGHSSSQ